MNTTAYPVDQPHVFAVRDLPELINAAGMTQRLVTGREEMLVWSDIPAGTLTAAHSHDNEQITWILEGEVEFALAGAIRRCAAGDVILVPGRVVHEVRYLSRCRIVEVFSGPRIDLFPAAVHSAVGA